MIGDSTAKTRLLTKVHDSNLLVPRQSQLLPHRVRGRAELWLLCGYGAVASYRFGLLANLWFWPFAVGAGTGSPTRPAHRLATNLSSFLLYSLVTSTAGWDTPACRHHDHWHRCGGPGHSRRVPAGKAGLQCGRKPGRPRRAGALRSVQGPG